MEEQSVFLSDRAFRGLGKLVKENRFGILGSLIAGFMAYMFAFTNKLPNFDDVYWLFQKGATLQSGRWGLQPLSVIFPDYSMPWIYGVFSLLLLTAAVCMILKLFQIRNPLVQILLSGLIIAFPSQISTFTYMFTATVYALAFLMSVSGVYLLRRGGWLRCAAAAALTIYSTSIYQAYISISAALLILLLIREVLYTEESVSSLLCRGVGYVLFLAASLGGYWVITKVIWSVTGSNMGEYAQYAFAFSFSSVWEGILNAYTAFRDIFIHSHHALIPTFLSRCIHLVCLAAVGAELMVRMVRGRDWLRSVLLVFLLAVLPLGMNCMFLFINPDAIHTLVLYSFSTLYILFAILVDRPQQETQPVLRFLRHFAREGLVAAMGIVLLTNIYIANEAYLNMHLSYENTYSITTSVIAQVQSQPGYTEDTPIAIMGAFEQPEYYQESFSRLKNLMGTKGVNPAIYSIEHFWKYYTGFPITCPDQETILALYQNETYQQMPAWPDAGFVQRIGDVIVVKYS